MATPLIQRGVFLVAAALAFGLLLAAGRRLYALSAATADPFYTRLGDLTLQLAVVVLVGALLKEAVDWSNGHLQRHRERRDTRLDFLR